MRPVQKFSKEYLDHCRSMTPDQIIGFLDDFRALHGEPVPGKSRLISIKVPETLLRAFQAKAGINGLRYQTQIKALMERWVSLK